MLRKPGLYNKSIILRKKGFSYNEILKFIDVGQGTISRWCSKIPLTKKQKERLIKKKKNTFLIKKLRKQAIRSEKIAKIWAKEKINKISNNNKTLLVVGTALYWAEGTKSGAGGAIEFTNTDSKMIMIMMKFFREIMGIPNDKFKIIVRISDKGNVKQAEKHWLRITKTSKRNLRNPEMLELKQNSKSLEKYPYGMCRIIIHDALLRRKMLNIVEEFPRFFLKKYD